MGAPNTVDIKNRRAYFEYELSDKFTAGIQLTGTEIKSVRLGKVNMNDGYCFFKKDDLFIRNMHISEYKMGTHYNHEPLRVRKLLLTSKELDKLQGKTKERGFTIIPVRLFFSDTGYAKIEIALARGKKTHDKRESIKERDTTREMQRYLKR